MELLKPEFSFIFPLIMLIVLGVYIYSLVDILKHEFRGNNKIVWIIVVLMLPLLGVFLYFLLGNNNQLGFCKAILSFNFTNTHFVPIIPK